MKYEIKSESLQGAVRQLVETFRKEDSSIGRVRLKLWTGEIVTINMDGKPVKRRKK